MFLSPIPSFSCLHGVSQEPLPLYLRLSIWGEGHHGCRIGICLRRTGCIYPDTHVSIHCLAGVKYLQSRDKKDPLWVLYLGISSCRELKQSDHYLVLKPLAFQDSLNRLCRTCAHGMSDVDVGEGGGNVLLAHSAVIILQGYRNPFASVRRRTLTSTSSTCLTKQTRAGCL